MYTCHIGSRVFPLFEAEKRQWRRSFIVSSSQTYHCSFLCYNWVFFQSLRWIRVVVSLPSPCLDLLEASPVSSRFLAEFRLYYFFFFIFRLHQGLGCANSIKMYFLQKFSGMALFIAGLLKLWALSNFTSLYELISNMPQYTTTIVSVFRKSTIFYH